MGFSRLAGVGALGFVTIVLGTNIVLEAGDPPDRGASPAEVAAFFTEHAGAVRYGAALAGLAWVLIAVFAAGAFQRIAPVERERGEAWSAVGVIGVAMLTVMFSAVIATRLALVADPGLGLWQLHNAFFIVNNVSLVVTLVGFSVGGLRTATIRPWHATLGLISATMIATAVVIGSVTATGGPGGLSLIGFAGWLLWLVWLGTFGVVLLRNPARSRQLTMP